MLKRAAAFLAAILMLTSVVFAADGSGTEYTEPNEEEKAAMEERLRYAFFLSDFGGDESPGSDGIMEYLIFNTREFGEGGAFYEYRTEMEYSEEYTIPYDLFISTVDKYFAVHSDMKGYFGEDYDKSANTVHISIEFYGGFGINMEPECFLRVKGTNEYHVLGVELDIYFNEDLTDEMKPHVDYFPEIFNDGSMQPCYVQGCFDITFVKDGDNFRFAGKKAIDFYTADGKVYLRGGSDYPDVKELAGIYDSLTVEADGASVSCEQAREFGYNISGLWIPESTEVTFKIQAEDGREVVSVTYNDGAEKALTPADGGLYKVTTGECAATLTVKTKVAGAEPPVETEAVTDPPVTDAATETDAPGTETDAPGTETDAPATETDAPGTETDAPGTDSAASEDKGGCGSVMSVSAVAVTAAAAVFAVSKRRH